MRPPKVKVEKKWGVMYVRALHNGVSNLIRNFWLTTAAMAVMYITLSIMLIALALNLTLNDTIEERTQDFSVGLYLNDDLPAEKLEALRNNLETREYVTQVTYVSKEEAKQRFIEQSGDAEFVEEGLALIEDNILPASFDVRFNDLTLVDSVIELENSVDFVDAIYDTSDTEVTRGSIDQYVGIQESVNKGSIIAVAIFAGISILIVFNTIRMAVFSRSTEIEIMKLIGATPWYIRGPFLVEASLYGAVAGVLAFSTTLSLMNTALAGVSSIQSEPTRLLFAEKWFLILLATMAAGALIGLVSSLLATDKYLRLKRW